MNPFANNNQQGGNNPFNNQGGNQQTGNNPFNNNQSGNQQQGGNNPFNNQGANQQQGANNPFNNNQGANQQQGGNNMFNNNQGANQQQGANNPFNNNQGGNQQQGGNNMFNNNQGGNQQQGGNNMFNNQSGGFNQQQASNQMLGNNQSGNQQTGATMFNNNQGAGNNMFSNNKGGTGMFNNNQSTGTGMFNNNQSTGTGMFNNNQSTGTGMFNNQGGNMFNQGSNNNNQSNNGNLNNQNNSYQHFFQNSLQYHNHIESIRHQLEDCQKRIKQKSLENIRIDASNNFKDQPMRNLQIDQHVCQIILQFQNIKKSIDEVKKKQQEIEKISQNFSKQMHKKLSLYKKCLLQATTHQKMVEEINKQMLMMNKQMEYFFKPLFFAYKNRRTVTLKQPNQFDLKISYNILNKLDALGQRVDDIITCEDNNSSQQDFNSTITVFEQLVEYYENVACNFRDFKAAYDVIKRQTIQRQKKDNYESVMAKVQRKARDNLRQEYKYYDMIRQIDSILAKRDEQNQKKSFKDFNKSKYSTWNF